MDSVIVFNFSLGIIIIVLSDKRVSIIALVAECIFSLTTDEWRKHFM